MARSLGALLIYDVSASCPTFARSWGSIALASLFGDWQIEESSTPSDPCAERSHPTTSAEPIRASEDAMPERSQPTWSEVRLTLRWRKADSNRRSPCGRVGLSGRTRMRTRRQGWSRSRRLFSGDQGFESAFLQRRDAMGRAARMATSSLNQPMECRDAPAERLEQVPRRPGPK